MEVLARRIANIVSDQTSALPEDREVYGFAAELLVSSTVDLVVVLSLAHLLGIFRPVIVAYVVIASLKYFGGGIHASKMINCLVTGVTVCLAIGLGARALAPLPNTIAWGAFLTTGLLALAAFISYAPVECSRKPLRSKVQRDRLRTGAMIVVLLSLVLGLAWLIRPFTAPELFWAGCMSLVWQSLTLLPGSQRLFDHIERQMF